MRRSIRKITSFGGGLLALMVLIPTAVITHTYVVRPHQVESLNDWFQVLLPTAPPVIAVLSVLFLGGIEKRQPVGKGIVWGLFCGSSAYMLLQAWTLATQYTLISEDGTAHWAMLQLPAIWIALPLVVIAIGIGACAGWIVKGKGRDRRTGSRLQ
ncbi:MAG: hypothetical protein ABFS45_15700 [Pseudomonadota bacterium]